MTEAGIRLATAGPKRVSCFELSSYFEDLVLVSDFELRYSDFTANNADASIFKLELIMPSFDIVSEVDMQEIDNAVNQARKELATRFDFKGSVAEITVEKEKITLTAEANNKIANFDCSK